MTVTTRNNEASSASEPPSKRTKADDEAPATTVGDSEPKAAAAKAGDAFPRNTTVRVQGADGPEPKDPANLFAGKKVVLFGVPGAFTPVCSSEHLPTFSSKVQELKDKGVELIACMSVNDAFVMRAWAEDQKVGDNVLMLADGNGELAAALGMLSDKAADGLGKRSERFAMIVDDLTIKHVGIDPKGNMDKSGPEAILQQL